MNSFKKIMVNMLLGVLFLGILVVPIGSAGLLKVSNHNVLSIQDTRVNTLPTDIVKKTVPTKPVSKVTPKSLNPWDYVDENANTVEETTQSTKSYPSTYINF